MFRPGFRRKVRQVLMLDLSAIFIPNWTLPTTPCGMSDPPFTIRENVFYALPIFLLFFNIYIPDVFTVCNVQPVTTIITSKYTMALFNLIRHRRRCYVINVVPLIAELQR